MHLQDLGFDGPFTIPWRDILDVDAIRSKSKVQYNHIHTFSISISPVILSESFVVTLFILEYCIATLDQSCRIPFLLPPEGVIQTTSQGLWQIAYVLINGDLLWM